MWYTIASALGVRYRPVSLAAAFFVSPVATQNEHIGVYPTGCAAKSALMRAVVYGSARPCVEARLVLEPFGRS